MQPVFQPTPSARRVTRSAVSRCPGSAISTHTLRKEGDYILIVPVLVLLISTHTLRKEGDTQ